MVSAPARGAVEPAASVSNGIKVTVAARYSVGVTPWTGVVTCQVSPGSSCGESGTGCAWTSQVPNGPDTAADWRAVTMALPVLRIV